MLGTIDPPTTEMQHFLLLKLREREVRLARRGVGVHKFDLDNDFYTRFRVGSGPTLEWLVYKKKILTHWVTGVGTLFYTPEAFKGAATNEAIQSFHRTP